MFKTIKDPAMCEISSAFHLMNTRKAHLFADMSKEKKIPPLPPRKKKRSWAPLFGPEEVSYLWISQLKTKIVSVAAYYAALNKVLKCLFKTRLV